MTAPTEISATMAVCLAFADEHGGKLVRHAGGYWTYPGCPMALGVPAQYFGTPTVNGLVRRGRMRFSQWQRSSKHAGEFPIAAERVPA